MSNGHRIFDIGLRVVLITGFSLCTWYAIRFARIDWAAAPSTLSGLDEALSMEPDNPELLARAGLLRNDEGDNSPETDALLRRAVTLNPLDSRTLIVLGLREEFRGDKAAAEKDLLRAVDVDHQFTPAWSLANFYFRAGQDAKFWPVVQRVLQLNPLLVNLNPLFDLCWHQTGDPGKILPILPHRSDIIFPYLSYLVGTQRTDAAVAVAPVAISLIEPGDLVQRGVLTEFVTLLLNQNRAQEAGGVWNQLVDRGLVKYGKVSTAGGHALGDPGFDFAPIPSGFSWHIESPPDTSTLIDHFARTELDGDQPERSVLLWAPALAEPGRKARLTWKIDTAQLSEPADPGLVVEVFRRNGEPPLTKCPLAPQPASCNFDVPSGVDHVQVQVTYQRAPGTVRIKGVFRLTEIKLEFPS